MAITSTPDGHGYWLIALDGGVFAYGEATFYGSLGKAGAIPITGIVANGDNGYRRIGQTGTAYPFGTTS